MSSDDQRRASALHGEALLAAQSDDFRPVLEHLAEATDSPDVRALVARILAGEWFANPQPATATAPCAGLLLTSGVVDYDRLGEVVREVAGGSPQDYARSG
jgi:hypothetical protein